MTDKNLLAVLKGERRDPPPVWLMRQAGRYLPEYRELRAQKGGFLELCYDPEAAAEVTLQPIRRFAFDGAILFSDILVIPHALGQDLWFEAGEGPRLAPPLVDALLADLTAMPERLSPVIETVRRVAAALPPTTTFLGFAGSPWTVATYMVAGQGRKIRALRGRWLMLIRVPLALLSTPSSMLRSIICRRRSARASMQCNCSKAGRGR